MIQFFCPERPFAVKTSQPPRITEKSPLDEILHNTEVGKPEGRWAIASLSEGGLQACLENRMVNEGCYRGEFLWILIATRGLREKVAR
jgi:hypothetical protein